MRVLKVNLSGDMACFRQATSFDTTTEFILTYDIIPITVVKGIIGAVLGYKGLADAHRNRTQPEYMLKLDDVGIGIKPIKLGEKFTQQITNTTGFTNKGMTNIVKQEVLSDVSYDIYITDEFEDFDKLCHYLSKNQTVFPVVLGRKGFNASFSNVEILEVEITDYYKGRLASIGDQTYVKNEVFDLFSINKVTYQYQISLPYAYNDVMMYVYKDIYFSDAEIIYTGEVITTEAVAIFR